VTLRDDVETQKLAKLSAELQDIENHLPIEPAFRNPKIGAMAPIRVVNSLFSAGEGYAGVQTPPSTCRTTIASRVRRAAVA